MNTDDIRKLTAWLDAERKDLDELEKALAALEMRAGQQEVSIKVNNVNVCLTRLSRESGYMPVALKEANAIRLHVIELTKAQINAQRSRVEGVMFKLRQATKEQQR